MTIYNIVSSVFLVACLAITVSADSPGVRVGSYLYAPDGIHDDQPGSLVVSFTEAGDRIVVAYGRRSRKDRISRDGTTEEERNKWKPVRAKMSGGGKTATFAHLPRDFYDLIIIEEPTMRVFEGIQLFYPNTAKDKALLYLKEVTDTLSPRKDRIGGWEGFFDNKRFERFESDGVRGCVFVQQMRLGTALAESGAVLKGCIHSLDICWLERAIKEGHGWQVIQRQQLYRNEISSRTFFAYHFVEKLRNIRIGSRAKTLGPLDLDALSRR